jgi:hypothetical protein
MYSRTSVTFWELGGRWRAASYQTPPVPNDVPIRSAKKVGTTTDCSTRRAGAWTAVVERGDRDNCLVFLPFLSLRVA